MKRAIGEGSKAERLAQISRACRGVKEDCRIWILSHRKSYPINSNMISPDPEDANSFKHPLRRG